MLIFIEQKVVSEINIEEVINNLKLLVDKKKI